MSNFNVKNLIKSFTKFNWSRYFSILLAGVILLYTSWGVKGIKFITYESTLEVIWPIISALILSYIIGLFFSVFISLIKEYFSMSKSMILVALFVFLFNLMFINPFLYSEKDAANKYKKLVEKQLKYIDNDNKEEFEIEIENIERDRATWKDEFSSE